MKLLPCSSAIDKTQSQLATCDFFFGHVSCLCHVEYIGALDTSQIRERERKREREREREREKHVQLRSTDTIEHVGSIFTSVSLVCWEEKKYLNGREREREELRKGEKIIRWNIQISHGKGKKTRSSTSRFYISREKINLIESRY